MKITPTPIPDLWIIQPNVFEDNRGFFYESFSQREFGNLGLNYNFLQDNHSKSTFGVLRGLHYQRAPYAQTKLVRVTRGKVLDVALDIRKGSPTYLQSYVLELSEENKTQLLIPQGFAHGFAVLSKEVEFLYKVDNYYHKESEGGILYNDPALNIDWQLDKKDIILSEKDKNNPTADNADFDFPFEKFTRTK